MYSVTTVSGADLAGCSGFMSLAYANLLTRPELWPRFIVTGATLSGMLIGAALTEITDNSRRARLCSVNVLSNYRRRGVGSALLEAAEDQASQRNCSAIYANLIQKNLPPPAEICTLLQKRDWTHPQARGVICETDFATVSQAPWMKHHKIASGCELQLWTELSDEERICLRQRMHQNSWFPEVISPFDHEERIVAKTSLALRCSGTIVGWCIFHRVNSSTTECASLVVVPELQGRGDAITLLARGIELHRDLPGHKKFIFDIGFDKEAMMRFFHRRLVRYLTSVRTVYCSTKNLAGSNSGEEHSA